jgi:hypothetical protein
VSISEFMVTMDYLHEDLTEVGIKNRKTGQQIVSDLPVFILDFLEPCTVWVVFRVITCNFTPT